MKLRVFTLAFDPDAGRFDDTEVVRFLRDRTVIAVSEHFFVHENTPYLTLMVSWRHRDTARQPGRRRRDGPDIRTTVPEPDRPLFDALRRWRNDRAHRDGRPAFVLLTNRQLVDISTRRPGSREQLVEIQGIGERRVADLGDEILALVARSPEAGAPPAVPAASAGAAEASP